MALFKMRKKVDEPVAASSPAESIEAMRRRARHRLIGAVVLVLAGVLGFPLLFDTQPRPVDVDVPIEIPDRNKVKPLPPLAHSPAPSAAGKVTPPSAPPSAAGKVTPAPAAAAATPQPAIITESRQEAGLPPEAPAASAPVKKAEARPAATEKVAKAEPAPDRKPEPKAEARSEARAAAAKAQALLESKSVDAAGIRYVVQVGAFAEKDKARAAQQKLDRAGLRSYTNVAETKNGTRIRVRAGPFASRAEADKAAQKIKGLDLPAAILSL